MGRDREEEKIGREMEKMSWMEKGREMYSRREER